MKSRAAGVIALILLAIAMYVVIFGPGEVVSILDAQAEVITAEGHRELDFAAAEAIRANARQVDMVTSGLELTQAVAVVCPAAALFGLLVLAAIVILGVGRKNDKSDYH